MGKSILKKMPVGIGANTLFVMAQLFIYPEGRLLVRLNNLLLERFISVLSGESNVFIGVHLNFLITGLKGSSCCGSISIVSFFMPPIYTNHVIPIRRVSL